jgi:hypothetical protein
MPETEIKGNQRGAEKRRVKLCFYMEVAVNQGVSRTSKPRKSVISGLAGTDLFLSANPLNGLPSKSPPGLLDFGFFQKVSTNTAPASFGDTPAHSCRDPCEQAGLLHSAMCFQAINEETSDFL